MDFVYPEDSGTGASTADDADAANFAAHRHVENATDYVESGMGITADFANDQFDVGSGMCYISDSSANAAQSTETRSNGVTYRVEADSRTGVALAQPTGDNHVSVSIDLANGPNNISVTSHAPGSPPSNPHIVIAYIDGANSVVQEVNRAPNVTVQAQGRDVYADEFNSIQAAVDYAADSSSLDDERQTRVYIPAGTYSESITLDDRVKLVGTTPPQTGDVSTNTTLTGSVSTVDTASHTVGLENVDLSGASVTIDTGTTITVNRFSNILLRDDATLDVTGRYCLIDGVRSLYDSGTDTAPPTLTIGGYGSQLRGHRGDVDLNLTGQYGQAIGVTGLTTSSPNITISGDQTTLINANQTVDINSKRNTLSNIVGSVNVNSGNGQNKISNVYNNVTLDAAFNHVSCVGFNSSVSVECNANANVIQDANCNVNINSASNVLVQGIVGNYNCTIDGSNNLIERVVGDVTISSGSGNVTISVTGTYTDNSADPSQNDTLGV